MADDVITLEGPWPELSYSGDDSPTLVCLLCGSIVPSEFRRTHDRFHYIMDHKERTNAEVTTAIQELKTKGVPIPDSLTVGGTDVTTPTKAKGTTPA